MTAYRLGDIRPNPFRDIENYPISEQKVAELIASYQTTRVWPNVIGRLADGEPQIAYGHHRLEAARQLYGDDFDFPLIVEDLDDDTMFKMMADENMDVYSASAAVVMNTISSLVKAYADGVLHLSKPQSKTPANKLRYAPAFGLGDVQGHDREHPYTAETLRAYLGWTNLDKVQDALSQLQDIEHGTLERSDFDGLTMRQAEAVQRSVHHAERAARSPTRKRATVDVVKKVRQAAVAAARAGVGHERIREIADTKVDQYTPLIEQPKVPAKIAEAIYRDIERYFTVGVTMAKGTTSRREVIRLIAANRDAAELQGIGSPWAEQIAGVLDKHADECVALAAELRHEAPRLKEVSNA